MSNVKNLWGELPLTEAVRTPVSILREQALKLTELTKGLLQGDITSGKTSGKLFHRLSIVAPALDNYSYSVIFISHSALLYPLAVSDEANGKGYNCQDEQEFLIMVAEILSSENVHKAISALLAQSTSEVSLGL